MYGMLMKPLTGNGNKGKGPKLAKAMVNDDDDDDDGDPENKQVGEKRKNKSTTSSSSASSSWLSSIRSIFDLSVLTIPAMALLSVANIFGMTGYYIPYVYIAGYAEEHTLRKCSAQLNCSNSLFVLLQSHAAFPSWNLSNDSFDLLCFE